MIELRFFISTLFYSQYNLNVIIGFDKTDFFVILDYVLEW